MPPRAAAWRPLLQRRAFHASTARRVQAGDRIPAAPVLLMERSPGNKVDLAKEIGAGRAVVVGVPAAFSPSCSATHIPEYIAHPRVADAPVFVVSVNDPFVMKAWAQQLDPAGKSRIRWLADPSCTFTRALDLHWDGSAIFGGYRAKRFALLVEDGRVKQAFVEPDNTGVDVSRAAKVLG